MERKSEKEKEYKRYRISREELFEFPKNRQNDDNKKIGHK